MSSILNAMRTFPKNFMHLNIVLRTSLRRIRNWKKAFRKFWKIRRAVFQIFGNSKIRKVSNEWCQKNVFVVTSIHCNALPFALTFFWRTNKMNRLSVCIFCLHYQAKDADCRAHSIMVSYLRLLIKRWKQINFSLDQLWNLSYWLPAGGYP